MLDIALFILLLVLSIRAFVALRRESDVRREFGQSNILEKLVLLYPLGPIALLVAPIVFPRLVVLICVAILFAGIAWVASRQRHALELSGTNRVKAALEATSTATLGAIVGAIYVGVTGLFAFLAHAIGSQSVGA